ncbi:hypothetical protein K456DRAFT_36705 [Colletotrichum gloeosporioides 23]|nr:hypothetical protein K456DRAFT_36705 [Colletotrichum gloeosporioides 23]
MDNTAGTFSSPSDEAPQVASAWRSDSITLHQRRESAETLMNDEAQHSVNEVDMENSESAARFLPLESSNTAKSVPTDPVTDEVYDDSTYQKPEDAVQLLGPGNRGDEQPDASPHKPYDGESRDTGDSDTAQLHAPTDRTLWTPPWLRGSSLLAFFGLFTTLWVALIILWRYGVANSGFVIHPEATPFSWTYSPTAILALITGLWRQVDYHAKMNQPWQQLAKEATPAANSVLLDYISPSLPVALFKALRNRHWTVAITATGFATLKLITVISTALLVPVATQVKGTVPVQINSTFDSSAFWNSTSSVFRDANARSDNTSGNYTRESHFLFANISSSAALTYFQLLQGRIPEPFGKYEGVAFQEALALQPPDILQINTFSVLVDTFIPNVSCDEQRFSILDEDRGKIQLDVPFCDTPIISLNHCGAHSICDTDSETYDMRRIYCAKPSNNDGHQHEAQLLIIVSKVDFHGTSDLDAGKELEGSRRESDNHGYTEPKFGSNALFELMTYGTDNQTLEYEEFYDGKLMAASATSVLTQLCVLFALQNFIVRDDKIVSATSVYIEKRLRFREVSLWPMASGLLLLSLLALGAAFTFSPAVSQDPSLLSSHATILARNTVVAKLLSPLSGARTSRISYNLRSHLFSTSTEGSTLQIQTFEAPMGNASISKMTVQKRRGWTPVPSRTYLVIITFLLPLFAIASAEVLYQDSEKSLGFALQDAVLASYGAQYISALVMLIVASLFNSLDFTVLTFLTFGVMRSRAATLSQGITNNPMSYITPVGLFKALRCGNYGLFSSNLAAMIGSMLTIMVSNLWIQKPVWRNFGIEANLETNWNLDWTDNAFDDGGATNILNHIRQNRTQGPDSALWNDLVFPSSGTITVSNDQKPGFDLQTSGKIFNFSLEAPSLRPRLFCDVPDNHTAHRSAVSGSGVYEWYAGATVGILPGCMIKEANKSSSASFASVRYNQGKWYGLLFDLDMGGDVSKECSPCRTWRDTARPETNMGCPSIGIIFGRGVDMPAFLACTQIIQQVNVRLSFQTTIQPNGLAAFSYRIQDHFDRNLTNSGPDDPADPFFRYIMSGSSVGRLSELADDPKLLAAAVNELYSDFMVQVIDSPIFRRPADQADQRTIVNGTMSMVTTRIFMNRRAKIILQTSLGSMVVFGLIAFYLVDLKGTLPRSPHSIASIMALFAGSDFCNNHIPEGAEWMNKQQLDRLFEGYLFSLRWWKHRVDQTDSQDSDDQGSSPTFEERFGIDIGTPERRGFGTKRLKDSD